MTTIYVTRTGDTIDYIAWKFYGTTANRLIEGILLANPGLAENDPLLPGGLEIILPEAELPVKVESVRLWD